MQPFTPVFYIPLTARWTLAITFTGLLVTTNNITSSFVALNVKGLLFYRRLEKLYTAIFSVTDLSKKFVDWKCFSYGCAWCMLSGSTISSDLGKYTIIKDDKNFMAASENSLGVWTIICAEFTFREMMLLMVLPTPSIGTLPWCPSL